MFGEGFKMGIGAVLARSYAVRAGESSRENSFEPF
jgi:hypothetical protein